MSEMVERVARAIAEVTRDGDWTFWEDEAKAAIAAMREPTDKVYRARPLIIYEREEWKRIWQKAIDKCLEDDK